jgi:hypothetical protein
MHSRVSMRDEPRGDSSSTIQNDYKCAPLPFNFPVGKSQTFSLFMTITLR